MIAFDMAFKGSESSDFVAGRLYGKHGPDFYLLDQERGHFSFVESLGAVRRLLARAQAYTRGAVRVLVEDKANGPAVIDVLKREIPGIVPVQPEGSKEARAHSVTPLFESGNVVLPDASIAPWVSDFRLELLRFPSGAHDDMVDSCVYCLRNLSAGPRLNISPNLTKQLTAGRMLTQRRAL